MTRKPAAIRAHESKPAEPAAFHRHDGRTPREMRGFKVQRGVASHAEGSALVSMGRTRVLCTASVEDRVPGWLRGQQKGWVTAEYAMLPRSTGERTITLDCDVLEADGGTRTAAINGALIALHDAFVWLSNQNQLARPPLRDSVAAISVGLVQGNACIDLDYVEDSGADVDMNVVMTGKGRFIEVQGTGEHATFDDREMRALLRLAHAGIRRLTTHQRKLLSGSGLLPE